MIWYENGTDDIVISTRVRLARNIKGIPFRLSPDQETQVVREVESALDRGSFPYTRHAMREMAPLARQSLLEKHLISRNLADGGGEALISADETVSVMLGEEDHIRIQCILPNLNLEGAYRTADRVDDLIGEQVDYAFSREFGYLTHCPTNVGTAMRASVMLHLPALHMSGQMKAVTAEIAKLGVTVRGFYGEGTEAEGRIYQLSNQVTLGLSEHEILEKLKSVASQVIELEKNLRKRLYEQNKLRIEDRVSRSYGTLLYAKTLSSSELKELLSDVRLGAALGLFPHTDCRDLTRLLIEAEPANLLTSYGETMTPDERDEKRAELVRPVLKKLI